MVVCSGAGRTAGVGASHQTGWTGTVAALFLLGGQLRAESGATGGLAG
jgi:hypothetical protein